MVSHKTFSILDTIQSKCCKNLPPILAREFCLLFTRLLLKIRVKKTKRFLPLFFFRYVPSLFFPYLFSDAIVRTRPVSPDCKNVTNITSIHIVTIDQIGRLQKYHFGRIRLSPYLSVCWSRHNIPGTFIWCFKVAIHAGDHFRVVLYFIRSRWVGNLENFFTPILVERKVLELILIL